MTNNVPQVRVIDGDPALEFYGVGSVEPVFRVYRQGNEIVFDGPEFQSEFAFSPDEIRALQRFLAAAMSEIAANERPFPELAS